MRLTCQIDTKPIGSYYGQLAAALRQDLPRTLRMEAAATIRRVMQMTKSAKVSKLKRSALISSMRDTLPPGNLRITMNTGKRGGIPGMLWGFNAKSARAFPLGVWDMKAKGFIKRRPKSGGFSHVSRTLADVWQKKMTLVQLNTQLRLEARGLDAKSWMDIIEKLGSGSGAPEFVRRARPISGKSRTVGFAATEGANTATPTVVVTNTSGLASATGGERNLASAITIRRKFFADSMAKGLFYRADFIARSYPWAKVSA